VSICKFHAALSATAGLLSVVSIATWCRFERS